MREEFLKNRRIIRFSFATVILAVMTIVIIFITSYDGVIFENGTSWEVHGVQGLKERAQYVTQRNPAILTTDVFDKILQLYKNYSAEKAYQLSNEQYPELGMLLENVYAKPGEENEGEIKNIDSVSLFYQRCREKVKETIESGEKYSLSQSEIQYAEAKKVAYPYHYSFTDQWTIYKNVYLAIGILMLTIGFVLSGVFMSQEKASGMNHIICAAKGKVITRMARNKINLLMIVISAEYVVAICIATGCILLPFGKLGWNASIQVFYDYYSSFLNWDMRDFYWFTFFGGWIIINGFSLFLSCIHAFVQNFYLAEVLGVFFTYWPFVIGWLLPQTYVMMHILSLQPIMNLNADSFIKSYYSIGVGAYRLPIFWGGVLAEASLLFIAIGICPLIYRARLNAE
ncbi:MAG: hypothetical protein ACI4DT_01290 [Chordicoccus sp.]